MTKKKLHFFSISPDANYALVVDGDYATWLSLGDAPNGCARPAKVPYDTATGFGAFVSNEALVCSPSKCWTYSTYYNQWEETPVAMPSAIDYYAMTVLLDPGTLWVMGGELAELVIGTSDRKYSNGLYIFSVLLAISGYKYDTSPYRFSYFYQTGNWTSGPNLPSATHAGCAVNINGTHTFVNLVANKDTYNNVYVVDHVKWTWTKVKEMDFFDLNFTCMGSPSNSCLKSVDKVSDRHKNRHLYCNCVVNVFFFSVKVN